MKEIKSAIQKVVHVSVRMINPTNVAKLAVPGNVIRLAMHALVKRGKSAVAVAIIHGAVMPQTPVARHRDSVAKTVIAVKI